MLVLFWCRAFGLGSCLFLFFSLFRLRLRCVSDDENILSCWLDDLDLFARFYLDVFCLIKRFCFVVRLCLVQFVFGRERVRRGRSPKIYFHGQPDGNSWHLWVRPPQHYDSVSSRAGSVVYLLWSCARNVYVFDWHAKQFSKCLDVSRHILTGAQLELFAPFSPHKSLFFIGGYRRRPLWVKEARNGFISVASGVTKQYMLEEKKWVDFEKMHTGRFSFASLVLEPNSVYQKYILVAGGTNMNKPLSDMEILSVETKTWTVLKNMTKPRRYFSATNHKDNVYVGPAAIDYPGTVEMFDLHKQDWIILPSFAVVSKIQTRRFKPIGSTNVWNTNPRDFFGSQLLVLTEKCVVNVFDDRSGEWAIKTITRDSDHFFLV